MMRHGGNFRERQKTGTSVARFIWERFLKMLKFIAADLQAVRALSGF